MPFSVDTSTVDQKFPNQTPLVLDNFKRGVITLIDQSKLPRNALREADNIYLTEDGAPTIRPGVNWFGNTIVGIIRTVNFVQTTNLMTNPNLEVDTTSYGAINGGTISRIITQQYVGTAALQVVTTTAAGSGASVATSGLTSSTTYSASAYIKATAGVVVTFQANTFVGVTYSNQYIGSIVGNGSWQQVSVLVPLNATENRIDVYPNTSGVATTFYVDAIQLEQASMATAYFDGSFANTTTTDYAWTGVANASSSTRKVYTMTNPSIDGFDYFDFNGAIHLVAAVNGNIYRSTDDAVTWTICTGGGYTQGKDVSFNQNNAGLYITTGVDSIIVYTGILALKTYTTLATPTFADASVTKTGLVGTTYTYYYKIAAVNTIGFSIASAPGKIQTSLSRDQWDKTANFVTITMPTPAATQERVDVYISEDGINYYYIDSIISSTSTPNLIYKDTNTAPVVPSTVAPTGNTSQGPTVAELTNIGSRMFGLRDPNNRYRIWFTSGAPPLGAFSGAYDGGYLDWQPGGKYLPVKAADYRDKSGAPVATIWCDSADGEGCILQMTLETLTIQNISITVPSAYKLAGSRGTNAPGSVINVLNDYMYYNSQAFYNLGSRAQFLNLLSTDEASANIRPTMRTINPGASSKMASSFFEAKVLFSVAYGASLVNTHTIVYDTEQKAWLPTAFTIGFKKFLRYTDTTGVRKLLAVKPGDGQLTQISSDILGDYGVAFRTSMLTGLYTVSKSRFDFQTTSRGYLEFSNPQGLINIDVLGIDRVKGYSTIKSIPVNVDVSVTNVGWDTFSDDAKPWDDTTTAPTTYSESSVKRYFNIGKELNAIQWRIVTQSNNSRYVLRTLQTDGTDTQTGPPKAWRLKG